MESLQHTVVWLNAVLSDYVLTVLLVGCGVFFQFVLASSSSAVSARVYAMHWANSKESGGNRVSARSSR